MPLGPATLGLARAFLRGVTPGLSRAPLRAVALAVACSLIPPPALSQTVEGELREEGTGAPIRGVLVVLMDEEERVHAGAFSDADGRFLLRAPEAGRWALRAERLGYAGLTLPTISLREGDTEALTLEMAVELISLEAVAVSGASRCTLRPSSGLPAHTLWDHARRALFSVAVVQDQELVEYDVETWERHGTRPDREPRTIETANRTVRGRPFESLPAEALVADGFARADGDAVILYGPDAEVLLSDAFLDTHCMYVEADPQGRTDRVGLGFEPVEGHPVPAIAGVIWLNAATGALQEVEYAYTDVPLLGILDRAGGRVEFTELDGGGWIVWRWWMRTLELDRRLEWDGRGEPPDGVIRYQESGGEVRDVRRTGTGTGTGDGGGRRETPPRLDGLPPRQ